ncbi:hypothetical protein [Alkalihalobacterium bogoriense]|uniref:hypothetical protein n=1 Tax=Alkalihalobacterium bogoriense TaxID=246272 RepID=UPI00047C532C|nr:hypothetical protein [Alkalihalobacterium bogoriense]
MNEDYQTPRGPYHTEWQEVAEKKHSVLGIISTILAGVMFLGSVLSIILLVSAVGDYVALSEETPYTYDQLTDMLVIDGVTQEQADTFGAADLKFGLSVILAFVLGVGYLAGLILGIIGVCNANYKRLYSILGLVGNAVLPVFFFIVAIIIFSAPLM